MAAPLRYLVETLTHPRGGPPRAHAHLSLLLYETEMGLLRRWLVSTLQDLRTADLTADVVRPISYSVRLWVQLRLRRPACRQDAQRLIVAAAAVAPLADHHAAGPAQCEPLG